MTTLTGGQPYQSFQNFVKFFVLQRYEKLFITHGSIIKYMSFLT